MVGCSTAPTTRESCADKMREFEVVAIGGAGARRPLYQRERLFNREIGEDADTTAPFTRCTHPFIVYLLSWNPHSTLDLRCPCSCLLVQHDHHHMLRG